MNTRRNRVNFKYLIFKLFSKLIEIIFLVQASPEELERDTAPFTVLAGAITQKEHLQKRRRHPEIWSWRCCF